MALAIPASAGAGERDPDANVIDDSYIVVYEKSVEGAGAATSARERELGFRSEYRYASAIEGFAASLSDEQVEALESDPAVDFVSEDRRVSTAAWVPSAGGGLPPTGVRRIWAARGRSFVREASQVNVAVIDTGVMAEHPDLNVANGKNCVDPTTPQVDGNGHGTHVAGTIAAKNNGNPANVVGVAPGTLIYGVKVLNDSGYGSTAAVICGVNWVSNNAARKGIGVVNMSLSGRAPPVLPCAETTDALHLAICNATQTKGINYVAAAGNGNEKFDKRYGPLVPAAYPQVLTVTAIADGDGRPGGEGPGTACWPTQVDDTAALFSNWVGDDVHTNASAHTIAAPGFCIRSTWIGSPDYNTISGTSMAAPHVAGMVALCLGEVGHVPGPCAGRTTQSVIKLMRNRAQHVNTNNPSYGFVGDPLHSPPADRYYGFLARTMPPLAVAP